MGLAARLLIALGVACFLLGAYLLWNSLSVGGDSLEATGEVVSYRETRDGDATLYRPRVRFETAAGDIVTFHGQLATPARRFAVGAKVPIIYPAANPQAARIATFADNWLGVVAAFVVGALAYVAGLFIRRAARRAPGGGA